jgi:predicted P-loop ATPase
MTSNLESVLYERRGRRVSGSEIRFLCPFHQESNPSCYYNSEKKVYHCKSCDARGGENQLREALGLEPIKAEGRAPDGWPRGVFYELDGMKCTGLYDYRSPDGEIVGFVARYDKGDEKTLRPYFKYTQTNEGRVWKMGAADVPRPLYRNERLVERAEEHVWIVEGEKCVGAIMALGGLATTSPGGSSSAGFADWSILQGRQVTMWPDFDKPGKKYCYDVIATLKREKVDVVKVSKLGLSDGGDVVDWLQAHPGATLRDLENLPLATVLYKSKEEKKEEKEQKKVEKKSSFFESVESKGEPKSEWLSKLILNDSGIPKNTLANVSLIMLNDAQWEKVLGINTRNKKIEFLGQPPLERTKKGEKLFDHHICLVAIWMADKYKFSPTSSMLYEALVALAQKHPFDPVKQWLESLPEWDNMSRADHWLSDCVGCPADAYVSSIASKFLISAVARTYQPGCKVDTMLILHGAEGARKSMLFAVLGGEFFSDQIGQIGNKDTLMQIHGPLIIEMAELDSFSRKEATEVKSFLSTRIDNFRPPYGRSSMEFPRTCVFAGTTNEDVFLKSSTGGRRFWPVPVRKIDIDGLAAIRDQLWAEALFRYRAGEKWWLEGDVEDQAREEQEKRLQVDPWEEIVRTYLDDTKIDMRFGELGRDSHTGRRIYCTTNELLSKAVKLPLERANRSEAIRVGQILKRLGWDRRKKREGDILVWAYFPPEGYYSRDERGVVVEFPREEQIKMEY